MKVEAVAVLLLVRYVHGQCEVCQYDGYIAMCTYSNLVDVPDCFPVTTALMNLAGNNITSLDSSSFQTLPELEYLYLPRNQIQSVAADTFRFTSKLKELDISVNFLTTVEVGLFSQLPLLSYVNVGWNHFVQVPPDTFSQNSNMEHIDMQGTGLESLPEVFFASMPKLRLVYLTSNQLTEIPSGLFANNGNITLLDVGFNNLQTLDDQIFAPLPLLQTLNLQYNQINKISNFTFSNNEKLEWIDLTYNLLTTINISVLDGARDMIISLGNNPWFCDCTIKDFVVGCSERNITILYDPMCAEPPEMSGSSWADLLQLNCTSI